MLQPTTTARLILRRPRPSDAQDFFDIFSDAQTCRMDGGYPPYTAMDDAFRRDFDAVVRDGENRLFIEEASSGKMIGLLHVMPSDLPGQFEIGYVIHRAFRLRGYATEAVRALLSLLQGAGAVRVLATCYAFNDASAALLRRLGFTEGEPVSNEKHPEFSERSFTRILRCGGGA